MMTHIPTFNEFYMQFRPLFIRQISQQLSPWQDTLNLPTPRFGWIRFIRKALGMTTAQLAKRLNISRGRVVHIELSEVKGAITIQSLKDIAAAMECELVYAIIPRESIDETLKNQAIKIAKEKINYINHSMALENQQVSEQEYKEHFQAMVKLLLEGSPKKLWEK